MFIQNLLFGASVAGRASLGTERVLHCSETPDMLLVPVGLAAHHLYKWANYLNLGPSARVPSPWTIIRSFVP